MTKPSIRSMMPFLSDDELERRANLLLRRWEEFDGNLLVQPPVPVSFIAEILLELRILWDVIDDTNDSPILACIRPSTKTITMNEARRNHFDVYFGTEEYTLAHEVGHWDLHVHETEYTQPPLLCDIDDATETFMQSIQPTRLCRGDKHSRYEIQAERYASYLLMPTHLLLPAIDSLDLCQWATIYALREQFNVSPTAMCKRLEALGLIHVFEGRIYRSKAERDGQKRFF
jgi:hypothetical protein